MERDQPNVQSGRYVVCIVGLSPPFYVFENVYKKRSSNGGEEERKRSLLCANKTLS